MGLNLLRRPWLRTALIAGTAAFGLGMLTSAWTQSGPADTAHFDVYAEGDTIHLLTGYGEKGGPNIFLLHRVSKDGGASWSKPVRVNAGTKRLSAHHSGENPSIAGGGIAASAASGNAASHAMHMVWLDSREGRQGLRYARSNDLGNTWGKDVALAPRTCDCCWNSIATRPGASGEGEVSVLYRGGEPRDMMHMASTDGAAGAANAAWSKPAKLGTDDAKNADLTIGSDGTLMAVRGVRR